MNEDIRKLFEKYLPEVEDITAYLDGIAEDGCYSSTVLEISVLDSLYREELDEMPNENTVEVVVEQYIIKLADDVLIQFNTEFSYDSEGNKSADLVHFNFEEITPVTHLIENTAYIPKSQPLQVVKDNDITYIVLSDNLDEAETLVDETEDEYPLFINTEISKVLAVK